MLYFNNFSWMWLVNELFITFSVTDTFVKTVFLIQGVSKRKDLMKILKVIFYIKPIPSHL